MASYDPWPINWCITGWHYAALENADTKSCMDKKMTQYGETQREEEDRLVGEQRGEVAQSSSARPAASFQQRETSAGHVLLYI